MLRVESIQSRFLMAIGAMLLPLMALGLAAYLSTNKIVHAFEETVHDPYREIEDIAHTQVAVVNALMPPNDYLVHGDIAERANFERLAAETEHAFEVLRRSAGKLHRDSGHIDRAYQHWLGGKAMAVALLALQNPVGDRKAAADMEAMDAHFETILGELLGAKRIARAEAEEHLESARRLQQQAIVTAGLVFLVGLVLSLWAAWYLSRSIIRPLQVLKFGVQQFGRGHLNHRIPEQGNDEVGQLADSFNHMADQLERMTAVLEDESTHDPLTGAINRREMGRQLEKMVSHSRRHDHPMSVIMLDLDHFKHINDDFGHQTGDRLLVAVADIIKDNLRPLDVFARYGGEEFLVMLPETESRNAQHVAERLRILVTGVVIKAGRRMATSTVSAGVASLPEDGMTTETLVAAADKALYRAKQGGRNQVVLAQAVA